MPSQCTRSCMQSDIGGRDPLWDALAENDRMREALEELDQHASLGTPPWYVVPDHVIEKAREALRNGEK